MTDFSPFQPPQADLGSSPSPISERLNPWLHLWTQPRACIRQLTSRSYLPTLLALAACAGVVQVLDKASNGNAGESFSLLTIIYIAAALGPIFGIATLYLYSALARLTGKWLGGKAGYSDVLCAFAWSSLPSIPQLLLWLPIVAVSGSDLFTEATPHIDDSIFAASVVTLGGGAQIVLAVWAVVMLCKCLGEVQGFSAWRALGSLLLAGLCLLVPIVLIALLGAASALRTLMS
jgi:hypothetical protein